MFKFRYQKALEHQIRLEDESREKLIFERLEKTKEEENLEKIEIEMRETLIKYQKSKQGRFDIRTLLSYENYINKIKKSKENQVDKINQIDRKIENLQKEFMEIRQEKKKFEKLKEKAQEEYVMESEKKEQSFIDDLSNSMYNRR